MSDSMRKKQAATMSRRARQRMDKREPWKEREDEE